MSYNTNKPNYTAVSYAKNNSSCSHYNVKSCVWKKTACCGSYKYGHRCTGCPNIE